MKLFSWMITLALAVMCFFLWALARIEGKSLADFYGASYPLPAMTAALIVHPLWLLFCPLPWAVWAVILSLRREVSPAAAFLFLGTAILAASLIFFPFLVAAVLPWLPMKVGLKPQ